MAINQQRIRTSSKIGLPSEAVVFVGERKTAETEVKIIDFVDEKISETYIRDWNKFQFKPQKGFRWINVTGLEKTELLCKINDDLGIHRIITADIANTEHSPKLQIFDNYMFTEFRIISQVAEGSLSADQFSMIIGDNFIATFLEKKTEIFDFLIDRITLGNNHSQYVNADYIGWALFDAVVDQYYKVLEQTGEDIESIEDQVIASPNPGLLDMIHRIKRNIIFMRKSTWPLREIIRRIEVSDGFMMGSNNSIYIKDLYDHIVQIIDTIETQREIAAELLDIYLSSVSFRLNEIMKVLTIIATIFIPLTFISSIYGMNFKYMPELEWIAGYPVIMTIMLIIGVGMLFYFKRKKWF